MGLTLFSSCHKNENLCSVNNDIVSHAVFNNYYFAEYYNAETNERLNIPPLFSDSLPNKIVIASDGSVVEYNADGQPFNTGTFKVINCGRALLINTQFLTNTVLTIEGIPTRNRLVGTIPAGGFPFPIRIIATKE